MSTHTPGLSDWLSDSKVDLVLDVGANTGQFAQRLRVEGYQGRIVSFEPSSAAFHELSLLACERSDWEALNIALGDRDEIGKLHIAGNSQSSSLLPMLALHAEKAPNSVYVSDEQVTVRTLDTIVPALRFQSEHMFLKIDAQGYEKRIVDGGKWVLPRLLGLQLELSVVPLYDGETLFGNMLADLAIKGFKLYTLEPRFRDPDSKRVLQVDCVFVR
jgi:FkbM family methyltransferase